MSRSRVVVVDYDCGNLYSLQRALQHMGAEVTVSTTPAEILSADRVVLPGVGAFGSGMRTLVERGFLAVLQELRDAERPILGICLGMQLLFSRSFEFGEHEGLQFIGGSVQQLLNDTARQPALKVPHIGWSLLDITDEGENAPLLEGVPNDSYLYFLHSFAVQAERPQDVLGQTTYGINRFCSVAQSGRTCGVQFHPEISGEVGLLMIKNFLERV